MRLPCPALILVAALAGACASTPPPSPSATGQPALPTASTVLPSPSSPAPSQSASPLPATPTPPPVAFAPGVVVEMTARVRQVADPERPRDDAYQSATPQHARVLAPLRTGYEAYLLESRVVDGREWWRIADSAYVGCCAPFGWIPAQLADGSPVFRIADVQCPAPVGPLTSYDVFWFERFYPAVCFGDREITLRGYLACLQPAIDAPYFLSGMNSYDQTGYECKLDDRMTVYGEIVPDASLGTAANEWRDVVDLTGHYFADEADGCRWETGNFMHMPVDDAPIDTAQFACRMRFYATSATALP